MSEEKNKAFPFHFPLTNLSNKIQLKIENLNQEIVLSSSFMPPLFGVTGLPSPIIQDNADSSNNGLLIWINGRGVIIDPPPFTQEILDHLGIPSLYIEWFILTKCHVNHDAGAFQKILASSRVEVVTLILKHSYIL